MKKFIRIQQFCLILALSIFTISCSDDDDDQVAPRNGGGDSQTEEGTLSATIAGVDKTSVIVSSFEASFGSISISGLFDPVTKESIEIIVQDTTSTGTYDLSSTFGNISLFYSKNDSTVYAAGSGSLTLLVNDTINNKLEGTFNFVGNLTTANDTAVVTNGKFNTTY